MRIEKITLNSERNVELTAFIQKVGGEFNKLTKRPGILILPGGGYRMCSDREAEPVALAYAKAGYQAFVLRYSVGEHGAWPNPLTDYEQAITLIRKSSDKWHVYEDKIAVIGFSAGGHLAACAATMSEYRPNACLLGYAVLSQESSEMCQPGMPNPTDHVDQDMCPTFMFGTRNDHIVPIQDSIEFQAALINENISFESHIYAYGIHGFSTGESSIAIGELTDRALNWVPDSIGWLTDVFGEFLDGEMSKPKLQVKVNGNLEPFLSVDCTIAHLKQQGKKVQELIDSLFDNLAELVDQDKKKLIDSNPFLDKLPLRDYLRSLEVNTTFIDIIDADLNRIQNQCY
ncbi:alpha/beta hydrolase [Globicatella sulfidifaciens]|uniref:Alpha/beta hydrolase n=1 Tax=Globicatella sulfidifaciens TaxID=136093 RepID=A0A7X8H0J5_9LACT|nr:alpha/beta hydrolase [Globicatella sulfidifaciens]NLJ18914.1 alpha/beta hydrolase [Globicatella sulfidifaciens]